MRGDGCYTECTVRKVPTMKDGALKGLLICAGLAVTLLGMLVHPLILLVAAALWYVITLLWPRFSVVYEYVFVDGQLDFDKILGGNARNNAKRIDLKQVITVAPGKSHALDSYNNREGIRKFDFTSCSKEEGHKVYVIIHQSPKEIERIAFEPDETLLALMKQKAPRKISEY